MNKLLKGAGFYLLIFIIIVGIVQFSGTQTQEVEKLEFSQVYKELTDENIQRIHFIKCMRNAGLSIERLKRYLDLFVEGEDTVTERKEILLSQREELIAKIQELEDTLNYLDYKINNYDCIIKQKELSK